MLQYLQIRNLALMDELELEFSSGFTAVTGETGAGKSILLGALSLLSGARTDKSVIRQGEESCEVEAGLYFSSCGRIDEVLQALDLPPCEEGNLILSRSVSRSKMSKVRINGRLTTLANLQELGESWIDFHGPGEPQKLFRENWQRAFLDLFARQEPLLAEYRQSFRKWRDLLQEMEAVRQQDQLSPEEREFLQSQIAQIDRAELSVDGVEELERDFNRITQAESLVALANELSEGLSGDGSISELAGGLLQSARDLAEIDSTALSLADRLESLIIEAEDLANEYGVMAGSCDFDEETVETVRERMENWLELKRKYGPSVEGVLQKRQDLESRLNRQGDLEGTLKKMQISAEKLEKFLQEKAEIIRINRVKASHELARSAEKLINQLGFKKAQLKIEVIRESTLRDYGNSSCSFLFAANAGQTLQPLNKIASSGEIARVMLALKAVLAAVDETPLLVFDEVDANIGGETAGIVGGELRALGNKHQVICVTHLPQVAARAVSHFVVKKDQDETSTTVTIGPIHDVEERRIIELARMLGDRASGVALTHARSLLRWTTDS